MFFFCGFAVLSFCLLRCLIVGIDCDRRNSRISGYNERGLSKLSTAEFGGSDAEILFANNEIIYDPNSYIREPDFFNNDSIFYDFDFYQDAGMVTLAGDVTFTLINNSFKTNFRMNENCYMVNRTANVYVDVLTDGNCIYANKFENFVCFILCFLFWFVCNVFVFDWFVLLKFRDYI